MARRGLTLPPIPTANEKLAERYRFDAGAYILDKLGWTAWGGSDEQPGQSEVIAAYELALKQQHERDDYEAGRIERDQLTAWRPGTQIQNWLRVEAGHAVGKTKLSSGLVNHFFDCFPPAIVYTFAPTFVQIHDLLWKEIKSDRRDKGLPGRINDVGLHISDDHFAVGRATNDAGGRGTERVQGQHGKYLMFVLDEAEGVADFVYNAVESMSSGGICIVLMLANPRTRTSKFHKQKSRAKVKSFRISCVSHPNVVQGMEVVPGAVRRTYVESMIEGDGSDEGGNCEIVSEHEPDAHTFTLPFPVTIREQVNEPGTIFRPNAEFLFRVLGIAPENGSGNTFVPVGRYEAACKRSIEEAAALLDKGSEDALAIRVGIDVARFGDDYGTCYIRYRNRVWRAGVFHKADTNAYTGPIREAIVRVWNEAPEDQKPTSCHIRVDGTGGFGSGVIDTLKNDSELKALFPPDSEGRERFRLREVHFGESPHDEKKYSNRVTELYAHAAESLKGLAVVRAPNSLEGDLCERTFEWINKAGQTVKALTEKEAFRKKFSRSPDDGDGFVLCVAPDFVFTKKKRKLNVLSP